MNKEKQVVVKKKGFSFLSFFLGILLGIIIIAGAVFGVGYYAATADLDKVMGAVGLDNEGEDGKNKYVNTDTANGGVKNLLELIKRVTEMAGDGDELTLGRIDELFPVADGIVERLRDSLSEYVEVDAEELKQVKFSEFGDYLQDIVMEIRPANFVSGDMNNLARLLLEGIEADCVTVDGAVYPLYTDETNENYAYNADGVWYSAQITEEGFAGTGEVYGGDTEALLTTGNYYLVGEEKIYIDPITIGSLTGTGGLGALGRASITEIIGESDESGLVNKLLGDVTVDEFMNGEADFNEKVNNLEITDFLDVPADSAIIAYLGYGLTGVDALNAAALKEGENVYLRIEEGNIKGVYLSEDMEGESLPGTKINEINARIDGVMNDLTIGELLPGSAAGNTILSALRNSTVNSLAEDIDNLTVNELYADEIYGVAAEEGGEKKAVMKRAVAGGANPETEVDFDPSYLYYELVSGEYGEPDATYKLVSAEEGKGKLAALPDDGKEYYTYGAASEFWQLLLTERNETGDGGEKTVTADEKAYSVNRLTDMIGNISHNMNYFTLSALNSSGILQFKNPEDLDKMIPEGMGEFGGKTLGELTIPDAISAMIMIINRINELPIG